MTCGRNGLSDLVRCGGRPVHGAGVRRPWRRSVPRPGDRLDRGTDIVAGCRQNPAEPGLIPAQLRDHEAHPEPGPLRASTAIGSRPGASSTPTPAGTSPWCSTITPYFEAEKEGELHGYQGTPLRSPDRCRPARGLGRVPVECRLLRRQQGRDLDHDPLHQAGPGPPRPGLNGRRGRRRHALTGKPA